MRISGHARARFRSRYMRPGEANEIGEQVTDEWLLGLVQLAIKAGRVEDVVDAGRPMRVIELSPRDPGRDAVFACQRPDDGTIVSLLERWQRDNNRINRWGRRAGTIGLGATIGEMLASKRSA